MAFVPDQQPTFIPDAPEKAAPTFIPDAPANNGEAIEPGLYGDTDPTGQKILENFSTVAGGYVLPELPGQVMRLPGQVMKGVVKLGEILGMTKKVASEPASVAKLVDIIKQAESGQMDLPLKGGAEQLSLPSGAPNPPSPTFVPDAPTGTQPGLFEARPLPPQGPVKALPPGTPPKLLTGPSTVQGEGFTVTDPSTLHPNAPQPERFNKEMLKQVRKKGFDNTIPDGPERAYAPQPQAYPGEAIDTGSPTSPIQAPQPSATQPDLPGVGDVKSTNPLDTPGVSAATKLKADMEAKDVPSPLLPGAVDRLSKLQTAVNDGKMTDVPGALPLTDRVRFNEKVEGKTPGVLFDQLKAGATAVNKARQDTVATLSEFRDTFGFKPGSDESKALQVFGEATDKKAAMAGLEEQFGAAKAQKISKASDWMRKEYDAQWVDVNKVRAINGQDAIPYRQDYFTHFKEINLLNDLGILGTAPAAKLQATVDQFKTAEDLLAQSRFARIRDVAFNFTKRIAGEYTDDAVQGFQRYVSSANRFKALQPYVNELNQTADILGTKLPGAAKYVKDQANYLGGGLVGLDSMVKDTIGPDFLRVIYRINHNIMDNIILGNPHVPFMHMMSDSLNFATHPIQDFMVAGFKQATDPEMRAVAFANSPELQSRIAQNAERNLNAGLIRKSLNSVVAYLDQEVGMHGWLTAYTNALRNGAAPQDAVKTAEVFISKTQGLINQVNTPPLMRSRLVQNVVPFQNRALAFSKYITQDLWQGKTVTAATLPAFKLAISLGATGALGTLFFGHSPIVPSEGVPMGGSLRHGIGGPAFQSAAEIANAADKGDAGGMTSAAMKALLLTQGAVPGGLQIIKAAHYLTKER